MFNTSRVNQTRKSLLVSFHFGENLCRSFVSGQKETQRAPTPFLEKLDVIFKGENLMEYNAIFMVQERNSNQPMPAGSFFKGHITCYKDLHVS